MGEWDTQTAEWYAEKYGEYATNRLAVERLGLTDGTDILDVGCGTGAALRHASGLVAEGRLIGVDVVPRMIEIARERAVGHAAEPRLDFRVGTAEDLPVDDDSADVVLAFDSFDHWKQTDRGLAEVRRVLRPGGRFAVVKDGGVPKLRGFEEHAEAAGFHVARCDHIEEDGITFTLWVCSTPTPHDAV